LTPTCHSGSLFLKSDCLTDSCPLPVRLRIRGIHERIGMAGNIDQILVPHVVVIQFAAPNAGRSRQLERIKARSQGGFGEGARFHVELQFSERQDRCAYRRTPRVSPWRIIKRRVSHRGVPQLGTTKRTTKERSPRVAATNVSCGEVHEPPSAKRGEQDRDCDERGSQSDARVLADQLVYGLVAKPT